MKSVYTNNSKTVLNNNAISTFERELRLAPGSIGGAIGDKSAHGRVFLLGTNGRKVLKVINKSTDFKEEFETEVRVGKMPGIEQVGTRIYESDYFISNIFGFVGAYTMDNLSGGERNINVMSLKSFIGPYAENIAMCPREDVLDATVKTFIKLLFDFYKITEGFHGDMHMENIQVIVNPNTGDIKRMKIIDYGTHTPFRNRRNAVASASCISQILNDIRLEFDKLVPAKLSQEKIYREVRHKKIAGRTMWVGNNSQKLEQNPLMIYAKRVGINTSAVYQAAGSPDSNEINDGPPL